MIRRLRQAAWVALAVMAVVLVTDWIQAHARLANISMDGQFDKPNVVADGKDSIVLTLRVTENGRPRTNDMLQAWLQPGNGLLIPEWSRTDARGEVQITYTPNPASAYDLHQKSVINVIDINIGRLLEVDKVFAIEVPVEPPSTSE